jgi:hypothetical protein
MASLKAEIQQLSWNQLLLVRRLVNSEVRRRQRLSLEIAAATCNEGLEAMLEASIAFLTEPFDGTSTKQ